MKKLSVFGFYIKRISDLSRHLSRIILIDDALDIHHQIVMASRSNINIIVNRNKSDTVFREVHLSIAVNHNMLSAESRQILYYYEIYPSFLNVLHHTLEFASVEFCACIAVITIEINDLKPIFFAVFPCNSHLRCY